MKLRILSAFMIGALIPVVALAAAQPPSSGPLHLTSVERARCTAQHGRVMIAGLSGNEMCALPYRDGGKRCTDGSQCAGDCMFEGSQPVRATARVSGRCQRLAYPFGCNTTITHGRVNGTLCAD
jgi:hypothetical protein